VVGLKRGEIDFGSINRKMGIVVYEYGLFTPPAQQDYFSINGHLYAGNAVLFANDEQGETITLDSLPLITWFKNADAVEKAIHCGNVQRPRIATNDKVLWLWPQPRH
jgi:hypothetical protein